MKKVLIGFVLMVLLVPQASGLTWIRSCINDTHMLEEAIPNIDGTKYRFNHTIECEYNCSSDYQECNPPPKERPDESVFIAIVIGFGMMALAFFYLSAKTTKRGYEGLQILFLIYGMLSLMGLLNIIMNIAEEESSKSAILETIRTGYWMLGWGIYIILIYIVIYIILYYFGYIGKKVTELQEKG